ncbi:MAG: hypothetical protein ACLQMF_20065 [Rectinemataceae bacterium]
MTYELELSYRVLIDTEAGGEEAARRIARDHVANDRCTFVRDGTAKDAGHFVVKGMSAEIRSCRPFVGNRSVTGSVERAETEEMQEP